MMYARNRFYSILYDVLAVLWVIAQWVILFAIVGFIMLWAIPGYLRWAIWG